MRFRSWSPSQSRHRHAPSPAMRPRAHRAAEKGWATGAAPNSRRPKPPTISSSSSLSRVIASPHHAPDALAGVASASERARFAAGPLTFEHSCVGGAGSGALADARFDTRSSLQGSVASSRLPGLRADAGVVACSVMPTTPSGLTTRRLNAFRAARADLILQVGIRANHGIASSSHHRGAYSGPGQLPKRLGHPSLIRRVPRASPAALTPPPPPSRTPPARRSCDRAGKSSPPAAEAATMASECVASCARRNE